MRKAFFVFAVVSVILLVLSLPASAAALNMLQINEEIKPGPDPIYLSAKGIYTDGAVIPAESGLVWTSSNNDIAQISWNGRLRFTGKGGPVTIRAYKSGVYGEKSVFVVPWPEQISIENRLVYSENPYRLMLLAAMSDNTERYLGLEDNVQWTTSNPWVAWVNSQGVVTFTGENGYVTIKAAVGSLTAAVSTAVDRGEDGESNVYRKSIRIKEEITYSQEPLQLTLVAVMSDDSEEPLVNSSADWSSSNPEVARVDSEGKLTFTGKAGVAVIKVSYGGYEYERVVTVARFLESLTINNSLNYTDFWDGLPLQLTVTARFNDGYEYIGSTGYTWSVNNKNVADITTSGILTFSGQGGTVTVTVTGQGYEGQAVTDSVSVTVPTTEKPVAQRLFIDTNVLSGEPVFSPKAYCLYSDGSIRDVTAQTRWTSSTPNTAAVYQGKVYLAPNTGTVCINAFFLGLTDQIRGYIYGEGGDSSRVCQLSLKQHAVPFSFRPAQINALAIMGNGKVRDVTSLVRWISSHPQVASVSKGLVTFTGRIGRTVVSAQGFGFRDEIVLDVTPASLQPQVERLVIEGELTKGANALKCIAYFNNDTMLDVTKEAVWNTSNKNAAVVAPDGTAMFINGLKPVEIAAYYRGAKATVSRG